MIDGFIAKKAMLAKEIQEVTDALSASEVDLRELKRAAVLADENLRSAGSLHPTIESVALMRARYMAYKEATDAQEKVCGLREKLATLEQHRAALMDDLRRLVLEEVLGPLSYEHDVSIALERWRMELQEGCGGDSSFAEEDYR